MIEPSGSPDVYSTSMSSSSDSTVSNEYVTEEYLKAYNSIREFVETLNDQMRNVSVSNEIEPHTESLLSESSLIIQHISMLQTLQSELKSYQHQISLSSENDKFDNRFFPQLNIDSTIPSPSYLQTLTRLSSPKTPNKHAGFNLFSPIENKAEENSFRFVGLTPQQSIQNSFDENDVNFDHKSIESDISQFKIRLGHYVGLLENLKASYTDEQIIPMELLRSLGNEKNFLIERCVLKIQALNTSISLLEAKNLPETGSQISTPLKEQSKINTLSILLDKFWWYQRHLESIQSLLTKTETSIESFVDLIPSSESSSSGRLQDLRARIGAAIDEVSDKHDEVLSMLTSLSNLQNGDDSFLSPSKRDQITDNPRSKTFLNDLLRENIDLRESIHKFEVISQEAEDELFEARERISQIEEESKKWATEFESKVTELNSANDMVHKQEKEYSILLSRYDHLKLKFDVFQGKSVCKVTNLVTDLSSTKSKMKELSEALEEEKLTSEDRFDQFRLLYEREFKSLQDENELLKRYAN